MGKAKWSDSLYEKNGEEKKKEQKNRIAKQCSEETGCEAEPSGKKHEEMQMQKKEKALLPEGFDEQNDKRALDSGKGKNKKKKKHRARLDEHGAEEDADYGTKPCGKNDHEMRIEEKNDKCVESLNKKGDEGLESGKEKRKKKHKMKIEEHGSEEKMTCDVEPCGKEDEKKEKKKNLKLKPKRSSEDFSQEVKTMPFNMNDEKKRKRSKSDARGLGVNIHDGCSSRIRDQKKEKKTETEKHVAEEDNFREGSCVDMNKKEKTKKTKLVECGSEENAHEGGTGGRDNEEIPYRSERLSSKESSKRVSFSDDVEIFPLASENNGKSDQSDSLIRGKRFSREEDEMIKKAVFGYIEQHQLGDEGLDMVLRCRAFPQLKNCWKDIGEALPWRPYISVYYRAHILFERDENRKWTPEEYEFIRKFHEKHGSDWKMLADTLGKHRVHVKDTWRRIKQSNTEKKGRWSQDEYQNLFDLVNTDLRLKAFEEKKSKHGMLRENICWGAISNKLSTRSDAKCCMKWYGQLASPMVAEGIWADVDDYWLLDTLSSLDACSMEDVEWDHLLEHRDGDVCRKRWTQMVNYIGEYGNKSFAEQVEVLSKRYCFDVLDAREAYHSGPIDD